MDILKRAFHLRANSKIIEHNFLQKSGNLDVYNNGLNDAD